MTEKMEPTKKETKSSLLQHRTMVDSEQGDALIQLVIAMPLLVILVFIGIRYGIASGAAPHIQSNLLAVLQSTKEPSYDAAVTTLVPNLVAVSSNINDFVTRFPSGVGPPKASAMLGLSETSHGIGFAALNCPCANPCPVTAVISSAQYDPSALLDANWLTRIQSSCSNLSSNLPASECAQTSTFVCYGSQVTFSILAKTQTVGAVFLERFMAQQRIRTRSAQAYLGAVTYTAGP